jgi:hypothetical protein
VIRDNAQAKYILISLKLIVFVNHSLLDLSFEIWFIIKDFGAGFRSGDGVKIPHHLAGVSIPMLLFQYFLGGGAAPHPRGKFSALQMLIDFLYCSSACL